MTQPPPPGHGAGPQPGRGPVVSAVPVGGRDGRLAAFATGDAGDRFPANGWLAMMLDELSGPDRRCPAATDDELVGILGRWQALESWAAAGKLGVTAELVRRRARPGQQNRRPAGLPGDWEPGTGHEVAAALAVSLPGADNLTGLAVTLLARLPGIYALLAAGTISYVKAKIIADELTVLDDELAARAEALLLDELAGKTPGQVAKLAAAAVVEVDPAGAEKRRERAERDDARVRFWREAAGTSALAAYGLPTDAALAANANIARRARTYKKARLDGGMDQLRVLAYLDILNGIGAGDRIASARAEAARAGQAQAGQAQEPRDDQSGNGRARPGGSPAGRGPADDPSSDEGSRDGKPRDEADPDPDGDGEPGDDTDPYPGGTGDGEPGGDGSSGPGRGPGGPRGGGPGGGGPGPVPDDGDAGPVLAASTNLTIPLATLLHLAARPGHAHGLGPLDPALARDLAAAAARSPHSTWCITITSPEGYAIGHGCARPAKGHGKAPPGGSRDGPWHLTSRDDPGPGGGYGSWTLTLPGGREYTVNLGPVPVTDCDHHHESRGYQPGDALRHLVQVRDGQCTFPPCSRQARDSDFEHALPYDQGGRTCACNAGARSRRCHQVKQSKGWTVTQPRPGWHQWTTPSGRTYTQGPMKYPA